MRPGAGLKAGRWAPWLLGAAVLGACTRPAPAPPAPSFLAQLQPGQTDASVRAHLPQDLSLQIAGQTGSVRLEADANGVLRELQWDVKHDPGTCQAIVPGVQAALTRDFGQLVPFPKWSDDLAQGATAIRRRCWGIERGQRALRLCCADLIGSSRSRALLGVTVSLAAGPDGGVADLSIQPPPRPPRVPAALPPLPTSDLDPVRFGACQACPPAHDRSHSPVVLEINRASCGEGICPSYQLRAHRDGTIEFMGRSAVAMPRYCVARVDSKRLNRVLEAASGLSNVSAGGEADDSPGLIVSALTKIGWVTQRSDSAFDGLFALAERLEGGLQLAKWSRLTQGQNGIPAMACRTLPKGWSFPESPARAQ